MIPHPRWDRVKELFEGALSLDVARRAAFLAEQCGDDGALLREVESLVASHEEAGGFLAAVAGAPPAPEDESASMAGRRIGPYRLLGLIGRGGMGDVYRAVRDDDAFKKLVAVKLVRRGMDTEFALGRFRAERQILARLEHPGIARLLDGGATADGQPYFVMEHVDGVRIDVYAKSQGLDTRARLELFRSVCAAVQYAHQNLVVHRDIKPGNILVGAEGLPKLLDFGIAKLLDPAAPEATASGVALMTPTYASPEQVRGDPITTATDVYSLGVVLYELLTGRLPYRLTSAVPVEVLRAVVEQEPEPPSAALTRPAHPPGSEELPATVPATAPPRRSRAVSRALGRRLRGDLDNIVLMALRKEPWRRYPSVEAFSEDIGRHLRGQPIAARKRTFGYRAGKFIRRNRAAVASAGLLFAAAVAFAISMGIQARRVVRERDKAERVSAFLVELFKVSDPGEARGNTVTAREVLDKGAARIDSELRDEPEVRAALMDTMGQVYMNLGLHDRSLALFRDGLETRRRVLGREHALVARSLNNLGIALERKGDYDGAEAVHREALAMRRKVLGSEHPDVAASLNNLGTVFESKGDYAGAAALIREALAMRRRLLGNEHPDVATDLNNLGIVLWRLGDYAAAEGVHREALAMRRKLLGNDHGAVAASLANLALVLKDRGDYAQAEALNREALALQRKLLGNEHRDVAQSMSNLGIILWRQGADAEAEAIQREALAIRRRTLGDDHPDVARGLGNLGDALYGQGRLDEAERFYREALELRRRVLSAGHPETAKSLVALGSVMIDQGRPRLAEPLVREALEIRRKTFPQGHQDIAQAENALGACLTALRRHAEAEPLLLESYPVLKAKRGESDRQVQQALKRIVRLYETWGKPEEAARYRALAVTPGTSMAK